MNRIRRKRLAAVLPKRKRLVRANEEQGDNARPELADQGAQIAGGRLFNGKPSEAELKQWAESA